MTSIDSDSNIINETIQDEETKSPPTLTFYNSVSKAHEPFKPHKTPIKWYTCGPTVYDSPHIGHARTYILFDVLRSILSKYFGYDIIYVMNVTDVDDKIINKARENIKQQYNNGMDENKYRDLFEKACKDITSKYETEFFDALKDLNVKPPTFVTRVTEYIDQIILFIEELVSKGLAYEMEGSVYFDVNQYKTTCKYPVFVDPSHIKDEDEETIVSINDDKIENKVKEMKVSEFNEQPLKKKNVADFVLWKKRTTDLFFESPFGPGRPGWHIECSAMAYNIFPEGLDIHSGGIDLAFPHHENEIAQSQGLMFDFSNKKCCENEEVELINISDAKHKKRWTDVFLHTGHLHIDGLKMSKSLKNFITIKEMLSLYTSRQIRICMIMQKWWVQMTYSEDLMKQAIVTENKIFTFLSVIESEIKNKTNYENEKQISTYINNVVFNIEDQKYYKILVETQNDVHIALCNNIDTALAMKSILNLIIITNSNLKKINGIILIEIKKYIDKMLNIFGVIEKETGTNQFSEKEDQYVKEVDFLLDVLGSYRNEIRDLCRKGEKTNEFYKVSDNLRDILKEKGFVFEDIGKKSRIRRKL